MREILRAPDGGGGSGGDGGEGNYSDLNEGAQGKGSYDANYSYSTDAQGNVTSSSDADQAAADLRDSSTIGDTANMTLGPGARDFSEMGPMSATDFAGPSNPGTAGPGGYNDNNDYWNNAGDIGNPNSPSFVGPQDPNSIPGTTYSSDSKSQNFVGPNVPGFFDNLFSNISNPGKYLESKAGQLSDSFKNNPLGTALDVGAQLASPFTAGITGAITSGINAANTLGSITGQGTIGDAIGNLNLGAPSSPNSAVAQASPGAADKSFTGPGTGTGASDYSGGVDAFASNEPIYANPILTGTGGGVAEGPVYTPRGARPVTPLASPLVRPGGIENLATLGTGNYYNPRSQVNLADMIRMLRLS